MIAKIFFLLIINIEKAFLTLDMIYDKMDSQKVIFVHNHIYPIPPNRRDITCKMEEFL